MESQQIDYKALKTRYSISYLWLEAAIATLLLAILIAVVLLFNFYYDDSIQVWILEIGFLVALIVATVFACLFLNTWNKKVDKRLKKFASSNHWRVAKEKVLTFALPDAILELFDESAVWSEIRGKYRDMPMRLSIIKCRVLKTDFALKLVCLRLDLPKEHPFIVLINKEGIMNLSETLPLRPDKGRILQLEGNFKSDFKLYVNKNTEREVLELLTPDVMASFVDLDNPANISFANNQLCIFLPATDYAEDSLHRLFSTADNVIDELQLNRI